ncbi:MAG: anti-sigma regulatory factor, partial [Candidatus Melainabacteria bacterium]|nr:anti-sigma regulatory factor [Candidatus Melainabacteria bacterium]
GVRLSFADSGAGIPDFEKAMEDGYTTGKGMGLGLGGAKRLMDEFSIAANSPSGTKVSITKWREK